MEAIFNYVLKSGIGLLALYLFYYALLRNQTSFRFNRLYLLLAPLVALALPLVTWPFLYTPAPAVAQALQAFQINEVVVVAFPQNTEGSFFSNLMTPANLALAIYGLVAVFLLLRLCRQLWHIRRLKAQASTTEVTNDGVHIMQLAQQQASFAFLRYIFLSQQGQLSRREQQQVLAHELAHVQLGHTFDVLYYELLSVALWFNPVVWFLKQELRNVHEFQADARVLEQHQPQEYVSLLSKEVLFNMGLPVGSHFQKPQVLKRLHMLKQSDRKSGWGKPLLTLPFLAVLLVSLSGQQAATDFANPFTAPVMPMSRAANPDDAQEPLPEQDTTEPPVQESRPSNEEIHNLLYLKPYIYVEQMPHFIGGEGEMMKFLGENVRYPEEAKKADLEGIVVASFVVELDGTLSDIQITKGLGMGTDEEVLRVIEKMSGNWVPGRKNGEAVPVRYTLPVRFAIK